MNAYSMGINFHEIVLPGYMVLATIEVYTLNQDKLFSYS